MLRLSFTTIAFSFVAAMSWAAPNPAAELDDAERKRLEGDWKLVAVERSDRVKNDVRNIVATFRGDQSTVTNGKKQLQKGKYSFGTWNGHRTVRFHWYKSEDPIEALYRVEKDCLIIIFQIDPAEPLPRGFDVQPNNNSCRCTHERVTEKSKP